MARCLVFLLALLLAPAVAVAQAAGPVAEGAGIIQELDVAGSSVVIDGMSYDVPLDVKVEIGGSYGAFTMLNEGMRVYYEFRVYSSTSRVVTLIRELPPDVVLEES
jgi:hypothetical protein